MKEINKYKISVIILALIVIAQAIVIFTPAKKPGAPKVKEAKPVAFKGKIAIVIDDWGYNLNNLPVVDKIEYPFSASVLPGLSYSKRVAKELHDRGIEVILHLPMEPREKLRLEKNTILTSMSEASVKDILEHDLNNIAYAKGVSNHMGSRATEDSRLMGIIFRELKKRNLYFLDSYVTRNSAALEMARNYKIGFLKRDIFLDNQGDPAYIRGQLNQLKAKARRNGKAVGIGHDRKNTLEVLREVMPQIEKEGFRFVFLSELVR